MVALFFTNDFTFRFEWTFYDFKEAECAHWFRS